MFSASTSGWIGLDIGCNTVKIAQLRQRREGLVFGSAVVVRRETPWNLPDWRSVDEQSSAYELHAAKQLANRFDGRRAACVLPMPCYDLHDAQLPDSHESFEELVERTVEALYGQIDGFEYDFWITPNPNHNGAMEANTLAVSTSRAMRVAQDCRQNRLQLEAVDGYPLTLARAISMMGLPSAKPIAAIDFGYSDATFCLVHGELPAYIRTMRNCGFKRWVEAVRTGLGVTSDEAETLLYRHGLPSANAVGSGDISRAVAEVVRDPLQELISEVDRTVSYLTAQRNCEAPDRLVLLGGGANTHSLSEVLEAELALPTLLWNLNGATTVRTRDIEIPATLLALAAATSVLAWQEVAA